ncbi:hypothetical protein OJAV_G00218850 [Oryzias javanicus]|uniref:Uncharacterized protein n=1 Tax=Oryzias javanicus TaxID=123683 RepID=A0A437C4W4_ORYJA|nr:hypothetical protein OJAV_G00218850 [Oryzias javanicus]
MLFFPASQFCLFMDFLHFSETWRRFGCREGEREKGARRDHGGGRTRSRRAFRFGCTHTGCSRRCRMKTQTPSEG